MSYTNICRVTTMKGFKRVVKKSEQITLQEILNGSVCLKDKGWSRLILSPVVREELIQQAINIFGGRKSDTLHRALSMSPPPQHWGLSRMIVKKHSQKLMYVAGQDYVWELNDIRKWLYKW